MIELDVAALVVIADRVAGIGPATALGQLDLAAAEAALAQARAAGPGPGTALRGQAAAAAAGAALMHALLRHRPFPRYAQPLAVAAGLQFLSLNGWSAELTPPATAAVVVEALAAGQLSPERAAAWLSPRLSPRPVPRTRPSLSRMPRPRTRPSLRWASRPRTSPRPARTAPTRPGGGRRLMSALLAVTVSGLGVFATACSQGPHVTAAHRGAGGTGHPLTARPSPAARVPGPSHIRPDGLPPAGPPALPTGRGVPIVNS
jgi:hypothetical protein